MLLPSQNTSTHMLSGGAPAVPLVILTSCYTATCSPSGSAKSARDQMSIIMQMMQMMMMIHRQQRATAALVGSPALEGAGAEVAACAAAAVLAFESAPPSSSWSSDSKAEIHAIDIADWSSCVGKLTTTLTTPPQLSAYASESAKAANKPLIDPAHLHVRFSQHDILDVDEHGLRGLLGGVNLCTIMFTLNELFTTSIARTTAFLLALTDTMALGSWLLVVDSPGSYSEVTLGDGEDAKPKRYPMKWLLDHTLLEVAGGKNSKWTKHVSDDSRWFRLKPTLKYPIDLENMRYQIHLYQRIES